MSIGYEYGKRNLTLKDFLNAESDEERLEISLRLIAECYDFKHFTLVRICCASLISHCLEKPIDWSNFVPNAMEAGIDIDGSGIKVYADVSDNSNGICKIFSRDFQFIGMSKIQSFKWIAPPAYHFWSTDHHYYIETKEQLSRHASDMKYKRLTLDDIEKIRKREESDDSDIYRYTFIMPNYRDKNIILQGDINE